jgi:glucosamine-6-phosphate deaminase
MTADLRVVSPAEFGEAAATGLLELMGPFASPAVGLATGNTPSAMYSALRALEINGADVRPVRPFALDEYVGDPHHSCSNRAYFARYWESVPGAAAVEQFDADAVDLDADVLRLATSLGAAGGLDVAVLGIGTNGHLAFNEPGSAINAPARVIDLTDASRTSARACWGGATPTQGMTLGMAEIMAASRILFLANGHAKAAVVARALTGEPSADCPASWLQLHSNVVVLLDTEAARFLP